MPINASTMLYVLHLTTDRVRKSAGDDDVLLPVELLTLTVHHQKTQPQPGHCYTGHHLPVVLQ